MVYLRLKVVNGYSYAYLVKSSWNKGKPRQKIIKYLGKFDSCKLPSTKLVFERDGYKCKSCGSDKDLTIDHIMPLCYGGSNEINNLMTLCKDCNISKSNKVDGLSNEEKALKRLKVLENVFSYKFKKKYINKNNGEEPSEELVKRSLMRNSTLSKIVEKISKEHKGVIFY